MDEPNLKDAIKNRDLNEMTGILEKLSRKMQNMKSLFNQDIQEEDDFATETFEKFHMFYSFVLCQTIITIILGIYQLFIFRKKLLR